MVTSTQMKSVRRLRTLKRELSPGFHDYVLPLMQHSPKPAPAVLSGLTTKGFPEVFQILDCGGALLVVFSHLDFPIAFS